MVNKFSVLLFVAVMVLSVSLDNATTSTLYSAEKEGYVLVLDQENPLFAAFIAEHQEAYHFMVVNLKKEGINNQGSQILKFLKSLYQTTPFRYLVFYEKVNYLLTVEEYNSNQFFGKGWTSQPIENITYRSVFPYSHQIHENSVIQVGIITEKWLKKEWTNQSALNINITAPRHFDDYLMHTAKCITYSSHLSDWGEYVKSLKKQALSKEIPTILGMEDRSSYQKDLSKGDYQLMLGPTTEAIKNHSVSFLSGSLEKIQVNTAKYKVEDFQKHPDFITTHIWRDEDKNQYVDPDGKEITVETIFDMTQELDSKKRMLVCPLIYPPSNLSNFYISLVNLGEVVPDSKYMRTDGQELKYNYCTVWHRVMSSLIEGKSIGQAVYEGYDSFFQEFGEELYPESLVIFHTFAQMIIYGPPETTIYDLAERAKLEIDPKEIQDSSEIIIPIKQTEIDFIIRNTGTAPLSFIVSYDDTVLDISPVEGIIDSGQELAIHLNIKRAPIQQFSLPKQRFSLIHIKTNAGNQTFKVRWAGA